MSHGVSQLTCRMRDGVTTTLRDRLSGREFEVRSKYLVGADGGNSLVADAYLARPLRGKWAWAVP